LSPCQNPKSVVSSILDVVDSEELTSCPIKPSVETKCKVCLVLIIRRFFNDLAPSASLSPKVSQWSEGHETRVSHVQMPSVPASRLPCRFVSESHATGGNLSSFAWSKCSQVLNLVEVFRLPYLFNWLCCSQRGHAAQTNGPRPAVRASAMRYFVVWIDSFGLCSTTVVCASFEMCLSFVMFRDLFYSLHLKLSIKLGTICTILFILFLILIIGVILCQKSTQIGVSFRLNPRSFFFFSINTK
jgi:hypothetical protein